MGGRKELVVGLGDDDVAKTAGICSGWGGEKARAAVLMCGNVNCELLNLFYPGDFSVILADPNTEAHAWEPHWKQTGKQKSSEKKNRIVRVRYVTVLITHCRWLASDMCGFE